MYMLHYDLFLRNKSYLRLSVPILVGTDLTIPTSE